MDEQTGLLITQLAQVDSTVNFLISCLFASETFEQFRDKVRENMIGITLDGAVDVNEYLKGRKEGWILSYTIPAQESDEADVKDFYRDDDGYPYVFETKEHAENTWELIKGNPGSKLGYYINPVFIDISAVEFYSA